MKILKRAGLFGLIVTVLLLALIVILGVNDQPNVTDSVKNVPAFSGNPYIVIHNNIPEFSEKDLTTVAYEFYSELDRLGRCGKAEANIGIELMPTEEREGIGQIKPSGWQTVKYDFVDGKYLYNRCHLIGFQLTGENANKKNLITGTRYMNVEGMLPFENMVADYVKETKNHVLYRVTPIYDGDALVARGVQMEAMSVEDRGEGICFNVYIYNCQPGVVIDYNTGSSYAADRWDADTLPTEKKYILNINSKKFHTHQCGQGMDIKDANKREYTGSRDALIKEGYVPASCCNP